MASPMVEGRVDPHKKAHFTLHISDAIADGEVGDYTSVKYNHKPAQTTSKRHTTLHKLRPTGDYQLTLDDDPDAASKDVFIFAGHRTVPKKSYILLFDPASQKATLEPLSSTYTFNLASKNGTDISASYPKIYPRKQKDHVADDAPADDLFGEDAGDTTGDGLPDASNPFDFRHFLAAEKTKRGDESDYAVASSPDDRTASASAVNTPTLPARKTTAATAAKPKAKPTPQPAPQKKAPVQKKTPATKAATTPTVRLERRATDKKPARKPAAAAKVVKSAEIVHSSDDSDVEPEPEPEPEPVSSPPAARSPSPPRRQPTPESDEDEDMEDVSVQPRPGGALASLGLGQSLGLGLGYAESPGGGPISLSAASSLQGSPEPHAFAASKARRHDDGVIDFGDLGGGGAPSDDDEEHDEEVDAEGEDDMDVRSMRLGSPVQQPANGGGVALEADMDADGEVEEDDEDPLLKEMMEGLASGSESEESEEE